MNHAWQLFCVGVMIGAVACGARPGDEGLVDAVPNTTECAKSGVDHTTCYPAGVGREPRPVSESDLPAMRDRYGDRMPNLKFLGVRAAPTDRPSETRPETTVVQLADYFDPKEEKYSLIVINVCPNWCTYCHSFADELVRDGVAAKYASQGVVFIHAVTEGYDYRPSTLDDAVTFSQLYQSTFTVVADPDEAVLGYFNVQRAWPFFVLLDARSMEIVQYQTGLPSPVPVFLDHALTRIHALPPKP